VIAVADTSPLCYLVLIGEIDLLLALFSEVLVPPGVAAELADARAPEAVKEWWQGPPAWVRIVDPGDEPPPEAVRRLHRGERDAILLARCIGADILLLDEKAARGAAKALGLPVMGLLGVLAAASAQGRVDVAQAVERLRRTNFRVAPALLKDLLQRASRERFEAVLKKVPHVEPEKRDRLD
jgi:predicted nucleic acid-binding protein